MFAFISINFIIIIIISSDTHNLKTTHFHKNWYSWKTGILGTSQFGAGQFGASKFAPGICFWT